MKKILILLVVAALFAGCSGTQKNEKGKGKAKTTSKKGQTQTQSVQKLENKSDTVVFLNRAEHVWEDLYYAAMNNQKGKPIQEDGMTYRPLPSRFDSREKIVAHFSRFWARPMAERMYDHLSTKEVKGKVYLAEPKTTYPVLIANSNTAVEQAADGLLVTVTEATSPAFASDRTVHYTLVRDKKTKKYEIQSRSGEYGKEQFE
ncbi:IseA DL-endopeptidase inhibitor family protein [Brevibacillus ruminantium]|uniref:IseA DL-endopeptidase inhibitor family protein n=1 Tax=Brevibacillus ruminantium TaxID=2950604 RepID=A0ABY4WHT1_9BACL|nr:IseA DL-endopeptidase inhibitor family protein [Brevibacillus ruminantium]USG66710.1 IseA DL-endopeptidase inhibitor family protein [Brevibacillus ruminantium]